MKVSLFGSGNAAWNLGYALKEGGVEIVQLAGRNPERVRELAGLLQAGVVAPEKIDNAATDFILLAVSDDAIADCAARIPAGNAILAHVSGRTPLKQLAAYSGPKGVFYPLQSMVRGGYADFREVPILIESKEFQVRESLRQLAGTISNKIEEVDSKGRLALHTAAVLVNNFVNYLNAEATDLCEENDINPKLLYKLIEETAQWAIQDVSRVHQTGPALRRDEQTLKDHRAMLQGKPHLLAAYNALTAGIQHTHEEKL